MLCCSGSDWSKLCDLHPIFCGSLSTLLHPVLASSFPLWQDFSKRASFPIVCVDWFYKKAVSGVVKFWEFEGILRCIKILRIQRKNPMKWVLSISRDYWVYLDITLQSFKIWEFWGEFWGIENFYRSKFSPATGVNVLAKFFRTQSRQNEISEISPEQKVCYSNRNVKFENIMQSEWREEKFVKGIVYDKSGYAFETNTKRCNFYSCSWRATIECTKKF